MMSSSSDMNRREKQLSTDPSNLTIHKGHLHDTLHAYEACKDTS